MDNAVARACCTNGAAAQTRPIADGMESILPCGPCEARAYGVCGAVARPELPRLAALATIAKASRGQTATTKASENFIDLLRPV